MPSSRRRRRQRGGGRRRVEPPSTSSAPSEPRDWAALPQDILLTVFLKLGPCDIMQGAELVCTTWRRVAVDEPLLWRTIDMGMVCTFSVGRTMAHAALDRGAGQCEVFLGSCDIGFLPYLVERAPSLKSLHLPCLYGSSNQVLDAALKNLPLLEDLEISPSSTLSISTENLLESVCQACPLLRKLRISFSESYYGDDQSWENIKGMFTTMCELRSLELLVCDLTAEGLAAILDHCPALESLYVTGVFDGDMDAELKAKCAKVMNLTIPFGSAEQLYNDDEDYEWSNDDYEFGRINHGDRDDRHYDTLGLPYHPQYHYLCDDLDLTDYGFPWG